MLYSFQEVSDILEEMFGPNRPKKGLSKHLLHSINIDDMNVLDKRKVLK